MSDIRQVMYDIERCICHVPDACKDCSKYKGVNNLKCMEELMADAYTLLKKQEEIVRCKDCENWIPGYITDEDDFIPPKCGKYQQMVGHSADDYCSLAESKERR